MLSPRCARPRRPLRLFASPRSSVRRSPRPRSSSARSSSRSPSWGRPPPASAVVPAGFVPCRLPLGSPGRTPGRPARAKASLRARVQARAKAALMKKFSSSASAWVTSRPNSTSTPIVPNNNNNYTKDVDVGATTPTSRAPAAPQQTSLPQSFPVKCLGWRESRGLWGVKHTRAPVDAMVAAARALPAGQGLERATLEVSAEGVSVDGKLLPIDCISYGVQDLVYTRVFCCVLVSRPDAPGPPFKCHAFVCESRAQARALTYALAAAFQEYSRTVKQRQAGPAPGAAPGPGPAAPRVVDLRTPEDIAAEMLSHCQDSEA